MSNQAFRPRRFLHAVGGLRCDAVGRMDPFAEALLEQMITDVGIGP